MKFNTLIIGGGLAGLTAGILLAEAGQRVGVVNTGQSALHFHTGSFGLLGFSADHKPVTDTTSALAALPEDHPYRKIGLDRIGTLAENAVDVLRRAGLKISGDVTTNHTRITPLGLFRPTWLTLDQIATLEKLRSLPGRRLTIISLAGFLDFYPRFIAAGLEREGFECKIVTVDTPDLKRLRASESEMRAANIARIMNEEAVERLAEAINKAIGSYTSDAVLMPAVINSEDVAARRLSHIDRPLFFIPTMGVSVSGISIYSRLMQYFTSLGGRVFNGNSVTFYKFDGDRLISVDSDLLREDPLTADNFILASGRFFSRGLTTFPEGTIETTLIADIIAPEPEDRYNADLFTPQPVFSAGVATDGDFHTLYEDIVIRNVYAAGSILAGANAATEDSGSGIAMLTAIAVAEKILKS